MERHQIATILIKLDQYLNLVPSLTLSSSLGKPNQETDTVDRHFFFATTVSNNPHERYVHMECHQLDHYLGWRQDKLCTPSLPNLIQTAIYHLNHHHSDLFRCVPMDLNLLLQRYHRYPFPYHVPLDNASSAKLTYNRPYYYQNCPTHLDLNLHHYSAHQTDSATESSADFHPKIAAADADAPSESPIIAVLRAWQQPPEIAFDSVSPPPVPKCAPPNHPWDCANTNRNSTNEASPARSAGTAARGSVPTSHMHNHAHFGRCPSRTKRLRGHRTIISQPAMHFV